ncbi:uncharacterized protein LOC141905496 isoform X2 [Tubulanus polymorphus]
MRFREGLVPVVGQSVWNNKQVEELILQDEDVANLAESLSIENNAPPRKVELPPGGELQEIDEEDLAALLPDMDNSDSVGFSFDSSVQAEDADAVVKQSDDLIDEKAEDSDLTFNTGKTTEPESCSSRSYIHSSMAVAAKTLPENHDTSNRSPDSCVVNSNTSGLSPNPCDTTQSLDSSVAASVLPSRSAESPPAKKRPRGRPRKHSIAKPIERHRTPHVEADSLNSSPRCNDLVHSTSQNETDSFAVAPPPSGKQRSKTPTSSAASVSDNHISSTVDNIFDRMYPASSSTTNDHHRRRHLQENDDRASCGSKREHRKVTLSSFVKDSMVSSLLKKRRGRPPKQTRTSTETSVAGSEEVNVSSSTDGRSTSISSGSSFFKLDRKPKSNEDDDIYQIVQKVKDSISSQFDSVDDHDFDNGAGGDKDASVVRSESSRLLGCDVVDVPKLDIVEIERLTENDAVNGGDDRKIRNNKNADKPKPKYKPKVHVMMRHRKRRKRKPKISTEVEDTAATLPVETDYKQSADRNVTENNSIILASENENAATLDEKEDPSRSPCSTKIQQEPSVPASVPSGIRSMQDDVTILDDTEISDKLCEISSSTSSQFTSSSSICDSPVEKSKSLSVNLPAEAIRKGDDTPRADVKDTGFLDLGNSYESFKDKNVASSGRSPRSCESVCSSSTFNESKSRVVVDEGADYAASKNTGSYGYPVLNICTKNHQHHRKKIKPKLLKSKHRNIIDPVLLEDVHEVTSAFDGLLIGESRSPSAPTELSELPDIFQQKTFIVSRRRREYLSAKTIKRDYKHVKDQELRLQEKLRRNRKDSSLKRKRSSENRASDDDAGSDPLTSPESSTSASVDKEHCLPLKKRHKFIMSSDGEGEPRKPGRPRKITSSHEKSSKTESSTDDRNMDDKNTSSPDIPIKRPRGRPPKCKSSYHDSLLAYNKRGRKPKWWHDQKALEMMKKTTPSRPVGRPKKSTPKDEVKDGGNKKELICSSTQTDTDEIFVSEDWRSIAEAAVRIVSSSSDASADPSPRDSKKKLATDHIKRFQSEFEQFLSKNKQTLNAMASPQKTQIQSLFSSLRQTTTKEAAPPTKQSSCRNLFDNHVFGELKFKSVSNDRRDVSSEGTVCVNDSLHSSSDKAAAAVAAANDDNCEKCEKLQEPPKYRKQKKSKPKSETKEKLIANNPKKRPRGRPPSKLKKYSKKTHMDVKGRKLIKHSRKNVMPLLSSVIDDVLAKADDTHLPEDSSDYSSDDGDAAENREYRPLPKSERKRKSSSPPMKIIRKKYRKLNQELSSAVNYRAINKREPRKRYQRAGIYSDTFKREEPQRVLDIGKNVKPLYDPSEHPHGLLPLPVHMGHYMFKKKSREFHLPYDIWWQHEQGLLNKNAKPSAPKYRRLKNNVYVDVKPNCKYEPHPCQCVKPTEPDAIGCIDDDCHNRMVYTECPINMCPCEEKCGNQRIAKFQWAPQLEKFQTKDRGIGIRTKASIKTGSYILEYVGEVVSEQEFRRRMMTEYTSECHHYCLDLDSGMVIDGYRMGSIGRFVNHSCQPNSEMQKWQVNGQYRIGLFALCDIPANSELTYDYNFHSFNLDAQQECKCGSTQCRGVVGGRTKRVNGQPKEKSKSADTKLTDKRKSKSKLKKLKKDKEQCESTSMPSYFTPMKPLSHREQCFIQKHGVCLLRNLEKVRRIRQRLLKTQEKQPDDDDFIRDKEKDAFLSQFMALKTSRSVKTRRLAFAEENTELTRTAKLAQVFKDIFQRLASMKDEDGNTICTPLMVLPSRKKHSDYYTMIKEPITMTNIKGKILSGQYKQVEPFDEDFNRLFSNVEKYCGKRSPMGLVIQQLREVFSNARIEMTNRIEEVLSDGVSSTPSVRSTSSTPIPTIDVSDVNSERTTTDSEVSEELMKKDEEDADEEEEIIRCICNIYRDEGVMIQCEKCLRWQHCECMKATGDEENYMCELCDEKKVMSPEIELSPQPDDATPGHVYYMSLLRDELQLRIGDTVYLMRDGPRNIDGNAVRTSYRAALNTSPDKLDVFRIERLWKDENGERFALGHHYLRPHETFHEPTRKFFTNEVFRVPIYEIIPLESIVGLCLVLDLNTYCKGRPKGTKGQDVYICEYRLDKTAHLFYKICKNKYLINTKSYCFDRFEKKLNPKRTYTPHTVPDQYKRRVLHSGSTNSDTSSVTSQTTRDELSETHAGSTRKNKLNNDSDSGSDSDEDMPLSKVRQVTLEALRKEKRAKLDKYLLKMLSQQPSKQRLDVTYLLDEGCGKRPRKKTVLPNM